MADADFKQVKELREKSGVGFNLCKEALEDSKGNMDKAMEYIRKKGADNFAKRSDKETSEGIIGVYVHGVDHKTAALVELNCETDFVAKNDDFRDLAHTIAMQVAAMSPKYVSREDVPADVLEKEKKIIKESDDVKGKPKDVLNKIMEGRIEKFYKENCLLDQFFFQDEDVTIQDLLNDAVAKIGEKIVVSRIYRMTVGG
jgi:elongation factor Ts